MGTLAPDLSSAFPAATSSLAAGRNHRAMASLYNAQAFAISHMVKSEKFSVKTGAAAGVSCIIRKTSLEVVRSRWQQQSPSPKRRIVCYAEESNKRPGDDSSTGIQLYSQIERWQQQSPSPKRRIVCYAEESNKRPGDDSSTGIQLYSQIERLITETARQSQDAWGGSGDWSEIEGAWVLRPKTGSPRAVIHFVGGIFVGAAPQLTYRLFLERLSKKGVLVIATPFASGFDHFSIADEVQFKFDRCLRFLQDSVNDLPTFGVGHSLGSVIHLLIGSRYAIQRCGNILMAFNNKEASSAIPLFSPVIVPMAQSFGPLLSQLTSSPSLRVGAEMAMKQLENLSPPIMRQVLPLVEQLPPLYMDLVNGREDFSPKPEETRRLIKSYYGVSRNLLIKFKDDTIDETPTLAQLLSGGSAISSQLDMSVRLMPGDHGLPLQQVLPDIPPAMADAVNRGGELLSNLTAGTPWEAVAKEVGNTLGTDSGILRAQISKDIDALADLISSWMASNSGPRLLRS